MYEPKDLYQTHAISNKLAYLIELYKFQLTEVIRRMEISTREPLSSYDISARVD